MRKKLIKRLSKRVQIIFRNKRDFKDISLFEFSNLNLISYITIFFILTFSISFFLSTTILKSFFDPRFLEQKANEELIRLSNSIDSLSLQAEIKDQYIENIMIILNGGENKNNEENLTGKTFKPKDITNDYSVIDSFFRKEFENTISSSNLIGNGSVNQDFLLISPVSSGIVLSVYDPLNDHFGVDFVCKKEEPIKATYDGTVLMSSWTKDSGYVISIVHPNNLISVYKHNSKVFVKTGQSVSTGDVISIIGDTGEFSSGPHLHFELWMDGKSINPSEFISL